MLEDGYTLKDRVCIVGIGETEYTKRGQITRPEFQLALEAILHACEDAGLDPKEIDGFASYSGDRNEPTALATALGVKEFGFSNMFWGGGGGGGAGAVGNAAAAINSGLANYVVAYRALAQGQFGRFGQARAAGRIPGAMAHGAAFGLMTPAQMFGMQTRRHMIEYGTKQEHLANISLASYKHAQRNPRAVMYGRPLTMEDYMNSRMIADPFHLYDCCLETDGAAAAILTTPERAKALKKRPIYLMAAAQGSGHRQGASGHNKPEYASANFGEVAKRLYATAGITPKDIDVAQVYENFTGMVIMSIEDHGFCKKGEGGPFTENGNVEWPDGGLPINTSGGNLAEAYCHGFELINETVRQLRGDSTCQVKDAEIGLVASGPGVSPVSDLILRR